MISVTVTVKNIYISTVHKLHNAKSYMINMVSEYIYSFILVFNPMMAFQAKTCRQKYQNNEVLCFDWIYCNF